MLFCKFAAYFQNTFSQEHSGWLFLNSFDTGDHKVSKIVGNGSTLTPIFPIFRKDKKKLHMLKKVGLGVCKEIF